jgi:DNA-binding transcriptional MerR regulator
MTQTLHKIGDVAETLGTTIRAIRYYEEEGLLAPARTAGGTRLYSSRHIDRLRAILRLAQNGYSLESIKDLADLRARSKTGDDCQKAVADRLDGMLADIDRRMHELRSLALEIRSARNTVQQCAGCRNPPSTAGCPKCPVADRLPYIELLNLIWDEDAQPGEASR